MGIPAALRELFATSPASSGEPALPPAIRPAVEIIARLSAERARLRAELARVKEELRQADAARGATGLREQLEAARAEAAAARDELQRVRAERDALAADLGRLRAEREALRAPERGRPEPALHGLLERVERALARLEGHAAGAPSAPVAPTSGVASASAPRPVPAREAAAPRPPTGGNGFMAALLRQNMNLRAPAAPESPAVATDAPEPVVENPAPDFERPASRGGLLGALVAENARLRRKSGSASRAELVRTSARLRRAREERGTTT